MRWPSRSWIAGPSARATVTWNGSFQRTAWLHWSRSVFPRVSHSANDRGKRARNSFSSSARNFASCGDGVMAARVYRARRGVPAPTDGTGSVIAAAGRRMAVRVARDHLLRLPADRDQQPRPAVAVLLLVAFQVRLVDAAVAPLPELRVPGEVAVGHRLEAELLVHALDVVREREAHDRRVGPPLVREVEQQPLDAAREMAAAELGRDHERRVADELPLLPRVRRGEA